MDAPQFALWLQGFAELNAEPPTKQQWQSIREHLRLVFNKVTPEVKQEVRIDVTGNKDLQKLIDSVRKTSFHDFTPPPTYQPYYLGEGIRPGTVTC